MGGDLRQIRFIADDVRSALLTTSADEAKEVREGVVVSPHPPGVQTRQY